ncbi:MAG: diguanylate cyclase [Gammaproteobacteria bacterium]|nr:diguanylate cyclase [Gammaproteobacteria bacterium]
MSGTYNLQLVVLSLIVAAVASYTALDLAGRVSARQGNSSWIWLAGGAFSMGTGIWAMHFIGMLAFHLPIPVAYDVWINALSWVIAIIVSGVALAIVRRPIMTTGNITIGATLMGAGIACMHYTGMAAMRMSPPIVYDPLLFVASVLVAIAVSLVALSLAFQLREKHSPLAILAKLGSALIMGLAIAGMHYTGMAAARFAPDSICLAAGSTVGLNNATVAALVGLATISILAITLVISAFDAHYHARVSKLADSLTVANEQLRNIALYDTLTALPNRFLLHDRLGQAVSRAERGQRLFAVLFVDLDRFKPVNDNFGHAVGDELLKTIAKRLTGCVRKEDTVARVGGDEFVVVLNEIGNTEDVATVSSKILGELSRPVLVDRHELDISSSIGISVYPRDGKDMNTLMLNADTAMYHAKSGGRNEYRFFVPEMCASRPSAA